MHNMHNMHIAIYCIFLSYFYICSTYAIRIIVKIENSQPCLGHLDRVIAKVQMHLASCFHGPPRCTKIEVATCLACLEFEHFDRNEVLILTGSRAFRAKTFGQRSLCFSRPSKAWSAKQQSMDSLNSAVYSKQSEAVICPSHPPRPSRSSWAFQKKRWWKSAKWNTELHAVLCTDV